MYTDAKDLENGSVIEGDLCIVGAGAAGISMALDWAGSSKRVILLEAGGFEYEAQMQELYRGDQNAGNPYFPLEAARLHYFGGTTGHWAGFCAPYDPIDFEYREWVPYSGWPITREDLNPFYERAQVLTEMGLFEYDAEYWQQQDPELVPLSLGNNFWTKMWQFSPPTRFGSTYRDPILSSNNVHLYTYATVVELVAIQSVSAIDHLRVRTPDGKELTVRAPVTVMACGAIQNARLLLASNNQAPNGLGNDHDLVGRFFMEHIEIPGANMLLAQPRNLKMYVSPPKVAGATTPARGELAMSAEAQRENHILNGTTEVSPGRYEGLIQSTFQINNPERLRQRREARARGAPISFNLPEIEAGREYRLRTRQEQAPNPESRVTLLDDLDAMGVPRVQLNWQLTELDKISIRRFYELLGQALGETGQGRVQLADWLLEEDNTSWPEFLSGGWHHMGTTRMNNLPTQGVVDADCKVHGIANLYIAGSGAFVTSGAPNPTLTLIALSLRLSDFLKQQIA